MLSMLAERARGGVRVHTIVVPGTMLYKTFVGWIKKLRENCVTPPPLRAPPPAAARPAAPRAMPFESTASSCAAMDALKRRLSGFESEDGRRRGLAFRPRPSDVLVTTTPKAGTTLMQQLCHQLRAGGDESFGEISDEGVVPWIELAADCGIDLEAPQPAEPRIFKTHCWQPHCPKGGKNIGARQRVEPRGASKPPGAARRGAAPSDAA